MKQDSWILALLAGSLAMNVYLGVSLRSRPLPGPEIKPLAVGIKLPALVGKTLDGRQISTAPSADARDIAVYVFSKTCSWCEKNLDNIRLLAKRRFTQYRFVGVSTGPLEGLQEYCHDQGINFEVMTSVSDELQTAYSMPGTPQLIILSSDGHLKKVFSGALASKKKEDAESYFGTSLPGLSDVPKTPKQAEFKDGQCIDPWGASFDTGFIWPVDGLLKTCSQEGWVRKAA